MRITIERDTIEPNDLRGIGMPGRHQIVIVGKPEPKIEKPVPMFQMHTPHVIHGYDMRDEMKNDVKIDRESQNGPTITMGKINMIKLVRRLTNLGLAESKAFVETALMGESPSQPKW